MIDKEREKFVKVKEVNWKLMINPEINHFLTSIRDIKRKMKFSSKKTQNKIFFSKLNFSGRNEIKKGEGVKKRGKL